MKVISEVNKGHKKEIGGNLWVWDWLESWYIKAIREGHFNCVEALSIFIKTNNPFVVMVTSGRWSTLRNLICAKHSLGNTLQNIQGFFLGGGVFPFSWVSGTSCFRDNFNRKQDCIQVGCVSPTSVATFGGGGGGAGGGVCLGWVSAQGVFVCVSWRCVTRGVVCPGRVCMCPWGSAQGGRTPPLHTGIHPPPSDRQV